MFKNPFSFNGRIRRTEYGISYLIYMLLLIAMDTLLEDLEDLIGLLLYLAVLIVSIWFLLAQGAKRCHDLGDPGWWQIVPLFGFWMLLKSGKLGRNEFGNNPKWADIPGYNDNYDKNGILPIDNVDEDGIIKDKD
jgi:uncharacterized membrane protein YhaH (DUF805 family)